MQVEINGIEFELDDLWEDGWRFDSIDQNPNIYFSIPRYLKKDELLEYLEDNAKAIEAKVGTSIKTNPN